MAKQVAVSASKADLGCAASARIRDLANPISLSASDRVYAMNRNHGGQPIWIKFCNSAGRGFSVTSHEFIDWAPEYGDLIASSLIIAQRSVRTCL